MCNNAPVVRDILKHWRRKANYTAADSRPRWTRLPRTAPVEWNRLPVGKALLFDTQLRANRRVLPPLYSARPPLRHRGQRRTRRRRWCARCRDHLCCVCCLLHAFKVGGPCSANVPWRADGGFARGSHVPASPPPPPPPFVSRLSPAWALHMTADP